MQKVRGCLGFGPSTGPSAFVLVFLVAKRSSAKNRLYVVVPRHPVP